MKGTPEHVLTELGGWVQVIKSGERAHKKEGSVMQRCNKESRVQRSKEVAITTANLTCPVS